MKLLQMVAALIWDLSLQVWIVIATSPDAQTIETFFKNLFSNGIKPIGYAIAMFMFGWAAVTLMFPGEQRQDNAKAALYRAVGGLVLILLTEAIVGLIQNNK